jgi:nickel superoxide dismutase
MKFLKNFLYILPEKIAFAHCDIPCGIYDPYVMQRAAHTILRMTQLLTELEDNSSKEKAHTVARITLVKEEHTDLLEEELETLRNDYFKEEHFKTYPNLESLFKTVLKVVSKARQEINMEAAQETLSMVQEIAEIFFKTKNVEPIRVKSVYPTGGEIVLHK